MTNMSRMTYMGHSTNKPPFFPSFFHLSKSINVGVRIFSPFFLGHSMNPRSSSAGKSNMAGVQASKIVSSQENEYVARKMRNTLISPRNQDGNGGFSLKTILKMKEYHYRFWVIRENLLYQIHIICMINTQWLTPFFFIKG